MNAQQEKKLNEIHLAVIGDPKLGVTGLVNRTASLERKQRKNDLRAAYIAGAIGAVIIIIRMVWEFVTQGKL